MIPFEDSDEEQFRIQYIGGDYRIPTPSFLDRWIAGARSGTLTIPKNGPLVLIVGSQGGRNVRVVYERNSLIDVVYMANFRQMMGLNAGKASAVILHVRLPGVNAGMCEVELVFPSEASENHFRLTLREADLPVGLQ